MPILEDPRQERFAQLVAAGATRTNAYRGAGYKGKTPSHDAGAVMRREGVRDRIEELQAEQMKNLRQRQLDAATAQNIDRDWVLKKGEQVFATAMMRCKYGVASQTLERIAKIAGLWRVSEPQGGKVITVFSAVPMTEEEWERLYAAPEREKLERKN
jgi:hypothetical protein